jgi:hypothetical protein
MRRISSSSQEGLVPVEQQPGDTRSRSGAEGLFVRIEHHRDGGNEFWKVCSKDGLISFLCLFG